jgi:hypothetical protein
MLHNSNNVTIKQNTIYDCGNTVNYNYGALNFQQDLVGSTSIRNMVVDHNQFIAKTATQSTFWARSAATSSDLSLWGIFDYNYYARPIADNTTIKAGYNTWDPTAITIAAWKTASSQDANSNKSLGGTVSTVNDLHFIYNDLTYVRGWTLSTGMKDVANTSYSGNIWLAPFTSLVLIGAGTVVPYYGAIVPPSLPVVVTSIVFTYTAISALTGGQVTDDGDGTVSARGICWSTTINPTISGSHTTDGSGLGYYTSSMTGLNGNTLYYIRAYATNESGTAYGANNTLTTPSFSYNVSGSKFVMSGGKLIIR